MVRTIPLGVDNAVGRTDRDSVAMSGRLLPLRTGIVSRTVATTHQQ